MNIERPLDFLGNKKGKDILISSKDSNNLTKGKLITFDMHINLVVEIKGSLRFVRGDTINWIE